MIRFRVIFMMVSTLFLTLVMWASVISVHDVSASHVNGGDPEHHSAGERPIKLKDVLGYIAAFGTVITLFGGGWAAWLHLKFNAVERKAGGIGKALDEHKKSVSAWRETFTERYRRDREEMIREYATNASVEKVEERMEAIRTELLSGMQGISASVDRLRESIKNPGG